MPETHRKIAASIASHESWAATSDRTRRTAPARAAARAALLARFEKEVDPDNELPEEERQIRADHLRKAHYQRLALKSAQARRKIKQGKGELLAAEAELEAAGGPHAAA